MEYSTSDPPPISFAPPPDYPSPPPFSFSQPAGNSPTQPQLQLNHPSYEEVRPLIHHQSSIFMYTYVYVYVIFFFVKDICV